MKQQPKVTQTSLEEVRPGDVVIIRVIQRRDRTSLITDTLGAVTKLHPDVPCAEILVQQKRIYFDGAWSLGRDIPRGNDIDVFLPNTPEVFLMRVLPD